MSTVTYFSLLLMCSFIYNCPFIPGCQALVYVVCPVRGTPGSCWVWSCCFSWKHDTTEETVWRETTLDKKLCSICSKSWSSNLEGLVMSWKEREMIWSIRLPSVHNTAFIHSSVFSKTSPQSQEWKEVRENSVTEMRSSLHLTISSSSSSLFFFFFFFHLLRPLIFIQRYFRCLLLQTLYTDVYWKFLY